MLWLSLFVALQIADAWTTHVLLKRGGREINPLMARLFEQFGYRRVLVVLKLVAVRLVARYLVGAALAVGGFSFAGDTAVAVLCALYAGIVAHNVVQMKRSS